MLHIVDEGKKGVEFIAALLGIELHAWNCLYHRLACNMKSVYLFGTWTRFERCL